MSVMDQNSVLSQRVTTYTDFPKKDIKKLKQKSAEKAIYKQLSNVQFQVNNLRRVSLFPDFASFFEEHEKFQTGIKNLIAETREMIIKHSETFLKGSEGAIKIHQNIQKIYSAFIVAVNDLKLRRQGVFTDHINKHMKSLLLEMSDYSQRVKSEPNYIPVIKPFITLYTEDFKQVCSQVTIITAPLQFEAIQQKTTSRIVSSLKRLLGTLSEQLLPSVSNSRTCKLITEIFVERYTREYVAFLQTIAAAPLFNERLGFLEKVLSDLTTDFDLYIADIKHEKAHLTKKKGDDDESSKKHSKSRKIEQPNKSDTQNFYDTGDSTIARMMLESELAKIKDKLDDTLFALAQSQNETKKAQNRAEEFKESLNRILERLKQIAKSDPTNSKMDTKQQIHSLIDEIGVELTDVRGRQLKEENLRDKLKSVYVRGGGKKEITDKTENVEIVDGIKENQDKLLKKKDQNKILKEKLRQALLNGGAEKDDVKKAKGEELVDMLEDQREAQLDIEYELNDIHKKLIECYKNVGGDEKDIESDENIAILDKIDKQNVRPQLIQLYENNGGDKEQSKKMSNKDLISEIEKMNASQAGLRDKIIDCYVKVGGKKSDAEQMNNSQILSEISVFFDKMDDLRDKLIDAFEKAGGSRKATDDMENEEIADALNKLLDQQQNIREKLINCYTKNGGDEKDTEYRNSSQIIDLLDDILSKGGHTTKEEQEAAKKLRERLIQCYLYGGGDEELVQQLSNVQIVDEIQKFISNGNEDHNKLLDIYAMNGGDKSRFQSQPNSAIIDAIIAKQKERKEDESALRSILIDSFKQCNANQEDVNDQADVMDNLQLATHVNEKLKSLLKDNSLFRERLVDSYMTSGGKKGSAEELDNSGILQNIVEMQNAGYVSLLQKIQERLARVATKLSGYDCSSLSIDDLLELLERFNGKTKVIERTRHRKFRPVVYNDEICEFPPVTSEIDAIVEVLVRITGKKSHNYRRKTPQQLLEIALPKIDQIIASNIDGTALVFEQIKDLLPKDTMKHQYIAALRDMVIKRTKTNIESQKISNNLISLSKMLNNKENCLPGSKSFESFLSLVKQMQNDSSNIIPSTVEKDTHSLIIHTSDVITKICSLLAATEYSTNNNNNVEQMKYTDDLISKNISLTQNISKLRQLLEEKDNQLNIEADKLQSAEKTFKKYAEANRALMAKQMRELKEDYENESKNIKKDKQKTYEE